MSLCWSYIFALPNDVFPSACSVLEEVATLLKRLSSGSVGAEEAEIVDVGGDLISLLVYEAVGEVDIVDAGVY